MLPVAHRNAAVAALCGAGRVRCGDSGGDGVHRANRAGSYRTTGSTMSRTELAGSGAEILPDDRLDRAGDHALVAPAATAGAICIDKARGRIDHMLATDLSNAEIVLGKLGMPLVPVLGLIACVLPLMALAGLLGGMDPRFLARSWWQSGFAVLGCSLTVTLSVWGRKTQDVLIFTYLIITQFWLFSRYLLAWVWGVTSLSSMRFFLPGVSDWLDSINPFYIVWAPYLSPSNVRLPWHAGFLAHCLVISCLLVALATFRNPRSRGPVRSACARARPRWLLSHFPKPRWLPGPWLNGNPVFWREWYRTSRRD